ncbi:MAG: FAD:protein FMN transferase [Ignavibacterium sp.]|nr:MAG: FAD:protein FMN transferase [Ignavibacterium sp.]
MARLEQEEKLGIKRTRDLMGSAIEIQVRDKDKSLAESAIEEAFNEMERIENLFANYNDSSMIQKINQSKDTLISVNNEIYALMALCDSLWQMSDGAFDVSLNKLIKLWGSESDSPAVPKNEELEVALRKSGWDNISLINGNKFLRYSEVELNFGAILKGYGIDRAIDVIRKQGIKNVSVNAGGEIKSFGIDWVIGIKDPRDSEQVIEKVLLGKMSIATSGDYENYFELDGKRYNHILNPFTGFPADSVMSVSVLHPSSAIADALATAVFVLGPTKGLELIENTTESEVFIVDINNRKLFSKGFVEYRN